MNKVFEVIEAHRIFKLPLIKFKILIHPNSYVHALVKFYNGTTKILTHDTSMRVPIFNSLYYDDSEKRLVTRNIDFNKLNNLSLSPVDSYKFPMIKILKKIPKQISLFETVLVSANDYLVDQFLKKKIRYPDIYNNLKKISELREFTNLKSVKPKNIIQILKLNEYVTLKIKSLSVISKIQ